MATRPANHRAPVTDPGPKQTKPISDPTRKTHPKPSTTTTTTSTIYNLTNHFSKLNPISKPAKTPNPLTKSDLIDTHLKVKSLSESVNVESQALKLGMGGHRAYLGGKKDKSLVVIERKSEFGDTHLRNKGFSKSVNVESETLKSGFHGHRACLGGKKDKSLVVVERKSEFGDTHLRNKDSEAQKLGVEGKRACLGGGKEKSLVVIDRGNDFVDTHLKVKGLSKSVNLGNGVKMVMSQRKSLGDVKMELANFMVTNSAKVVSTDMPPFMQIHAVGLARKTKDSLEKFTSKSLALSLKREFDEVYGPAWHCVVGTSFGSFVTHSVGGFLYFALDQKWFVLLFKTTVHRTSE